MVQLLLHLWGDYLTQSDWMAQNKTKSHLAALAHALCYSAPFLWLCYVPWSRLEPEHIRWAAWFVIFGTHFFIDRYRLARYVVWAKNLVGPKREWVEAVHRGNSYDQEVTHVGRTMPLSKCPTGYPPQTPIWLSTWLLIIADNTLHLTINYAALRWL